MTALVAGKGGAGASVSALALALAAPGRSLLAECDPAGGDALPGYLQGTLPAVRGLAPLAVAQLRGRMAEEFDQQLVDLEAPRRQRLLLPGVTDPAQSATVASVWSSVADHLHRLAGEGWRVLVDCGRPSTVHFGWPLLERADRVLLVVRGILPSVSAAVPVLRLLRQRLATEPDGTTSADKLRLLVVEAGPYRAADLARVLDADVAGHLPSDPRTAQRLATGGAVSPRSPLLRAAAALDPDAAAPAAGPEPTPPPEAGDAT